MDTQQNQTGTTPHIPKITHYVVASVTASEDWKTKQITVKGLLGIAPDSETVIEYPITIYRFGHWNKTGIRKQMREVKTELLAKMAALGYTRKDLTEPLVWREVR